MTLQPVLISAPIAGLSPVSVATANQLLVRWRHGLGPCNRPFGIEGWTLDLHGVPIAVAISASTVSDHVVSSHGDYRRDELVELARLCSDLEQRWATRPMLRLWREAAAPAWPYWRPKAAVSYSLRRHSGDLYRFDGWELWGERVGSSGGGTWGAKQTQDDPSGGRKRLWGWRYDR